MHTISFLQFFIPKPRPFIPNSLSYNIAKYCSVLDDATSNEVSVEDCRVVKDRDWTSIVEKKKRAVLNAAREIMTSEETFVGVLKLLNCDFREAVKEAGGAKVIPEEDEKRIFNNLMEMQILNGDLLKDFTESIENWDKRPQIAHIIVKKGPFLKLYTSYMKDFKSAMAHYCACCSKYPEFMTVVKNFEAREICKGLKLEHFLLKPVQRLPQYKLLLESYLKHLSKASPDYKPATEALSIVTKAANHANDQIKQDVNIDMNNCSIQTLIVSFFASGQFSQVVRTPISPW